jgi:hypothetical protein
MPEPAAPAPIPAHLKTPPVPEARDRRAPAAATREQPRRAQPRARHADRQLEVTVEIGVIEIVSDTVRRAPGRTQAPVTLADYLRSRGPQ